MFLTRDIIFLVTKVAVMAGEIVLDIYENESFNVENKKDNSPLTKADKLSHICIVEGLKETDIPILSEEGKEKSFEERSKWKKFWLIDPVDGTKEFINKNGDFTINIALIENGVTKLGVVYVPVTRELYYTNETKTSTFKLLVPKNKIEFKELLFHAQDEIKPSEIKDKSKITVVGSRSHMNEETKLFIEDLKNKFKEVKIVSRGSSLKFCMVAEGKADVYPRFALTMEWDTAAGQAICEAVGIKVIDQKTKNVLVYNKENLLNNYFYVGYN